MNSPVPLRIDGLNVRRGGQDVLANVSLEIDGPGLIGLIGPNGGGKSTLLKAVLGMVVPSRGSISVFGQPPARAAPRIGYVPQAETFNRGFPITLRGLVETALLGPTLWPRRTTEKDQARVEAALAVTGTADLAERPLTALSGGELQRGLIARALATEPEMFLLDEPTAGVDQSHASGLFSLMCDLGQARPVIVVSHDLAEVAAHCTQVYCLNRQLWQAPDGADTATLAHEIFGGPAYCRRREGEAA